MPSYKLVFSEESLLDMKEAIEWYDLQQVGLGKKFNATVAETLVKIKSNPYQAAIKYADIRTLSCKVFPYAVHYQIDETTFSIRILSVFHFSRKPGWLSGEDRE